MQHMQPFIISMISSSLCICSCFFAPQQGVVDARLAELVLDHVILASFLSFLSFLKPTFRMWLSSIVLPLPRKPIRTVM